MARSPLIARRVESLLGAAVISTAPVAGGDSAAATRVRLNDGSSALAKTLPKAPPGFFSTEAAALAWLGDVADGVRVPEVLGVDDECLVVRWVDPGRPSVEAAAEFGHRLARTHAAGAPAFGAAPPQADGSPGGDSYIGRMPMLNRTAPSWAEFYATRRVLPYLKVARDRGHVTDGDAAAVEKVIARLQALVPDEPPARLHGDLWNGNVVWGLDEVVVVDPSAHGGHRETDLAMLALFGLPHLPRVFTAYTETTPLAEGWEERQRIHHLFPLLVHAAMFGGGYGAKAGAAARTFL